VARDEVRWWNQAFAADYCNRSWFLRRRRSRYMRSS